MNKRETVWLVVRLIGVYVAYLSIVSLFTTIGAASAFYSASTSTSVTPKSEAENVRPSMPTPFPMSPQPETAATASKVDPAAEKLKSDAFRTLLFCVFLTLIYGAVGVYLVTNGRLLFNILISERSTSRREADPAVTTLDL